MSKFDKFLKKASQQMTSNLGRLEGKLDEFKTSASQHLQNLGSNTEWTTDDLVPQNFPVDMPARIDINGSSYRPVKLLDEGGFSFVFIAKNMETGQDFALKRLLIHEEEMLTSAMNEIKYMEKLNGHSNIIKLIGHKQIPKGSQTELYILMELADDSLISLLQKKADYGDRFKEDELLSIFLSICKAVAHMHEQNPPIIHRDLKVENVLITGGEYKLCDFGSCTTTVYHLQDKREKQRAEEDIQKNTTMAYWSPEMADLYSGYTIDEKSDVWALGCVLYKMCYFVGPFENASTLQIINCKYRIPDAKYSSEITDLIKYMLTVDPSKRPSVFDVIERISTILGLEANVHRPAPRQNQPKQMAPRQMAPRQQPVKQTSIKSPPPKSSSSGGGDLFSMLDWVENDGQKTTPQSSSSDFDNAFGNDDWSADFSELDSSTTTAPKLQQQQQQQPSKSPTTPSRPSHVRQVSNSSQSSASSGLDLFSQLDWQPSNTTPSIRPPSPQNSSRSSSHSRNSSATTSADFTVDSLFQSQENTFTSAVKPSDLHKKRTWVIKATNGLPTQPKHKYVKRITVDVWEHNNLLEYLLLLRARPIFTKEVIAFKSLVLLHHVLQNGSQQSLKSARENLTFLTDMKDAWSSAKGTDPAFTRLIILYASYLVDRLSFSRAHPAFEPNFSLDRFMKTSGDISPLMGSTTPFNIAALLGLVELLQSLLEVQKASLADMTSPCKHGCIIPLVYDAEDLHNIIVYLSKRISKSIKPNDLNQAVTKFNNHYSQMIRFFTQVEKFPPLAAIVTVPQLPLSPPSVFSPNNVEPPKSIPPPPTYLRGNKPKQEYDEGFDSDLDDFETIDSENTIALELSVGEVSIKRISMQPGNTICADCPLKDPRIAVTNLGILICDPCYSVHRNLGEQFSKPQPLDNNLSTEQMRFLECVGNDRANKFWEANLTETKPNGTNAQALNTYIRNKYISKKYLSPAALRAPMPRNLSNPNLARPMPMGGPNFMNHPSPSRTRSFDANNFVPPQQQQFANTSPTAYQQPPFQQQQYQNGPFVPHHQRVQSNGSPTLDTLNVFQQFK